MERNPFTRSEFERQKDWENQEHSRRDEHHGDGDKRRSLHMGLGNIHMIQSIQQKNKDTLNSKGIGHSSERKPDPFKQSEKTDSST